MKNQTIKLRHKWSKDVKQLKKIDTELEQCTKCNLYRFKALGIWMYTKEKLSDKNLYVHRVGNEGCNAIKN